MKESESRERKADKGEEKRENQALTSEFCRTDMDSLDFYRRSPHGFFGRIFGKEMEDLFALWYDNRTINEAMTQKKKLIFVQGHF